MAEDSALQPAGRRLLITSRMPVRWGDMDAYGHVNNTVYFRYMEQTREMEWLEQMGSGGDPDNPVAPVIINAACTFLIPVNYPATLIVRMYGGEPGRSSVMTWYELLVEGDERLAGQLQGGVDEPADGQVGSAPRCGARRGNLVSCYRSDVAGLGWHRNQEMRDELPRCRAPAVGADGDRIAAANITAFARGAERRWGRALPDYPALHAWSVDQPAEFWASVWELGELRGQMGAVVLRTGSACPVPGGSPRPG